ncbi:MAG: hypothetical protein ACFFCT_12045 [Candidatus Odinarchaeota archaeon]
MKARLSQIIGRDIGSSLQLSGTENIFLREGEDERMSCVEFCSGESSVTYPIQFVPQITDWLQEKFAEWLDEAQYDKE